MNSRQVLNRMQNGASLHLHFEDGERVWWLDPPGNRISCTVAALVLRDQRVLAQGDSLFESEQPQTWRLAG